MSRPKPGIGDAVEVKKVKFDNRCYEVMARTIWVPATVVGPTRPDWGLIVAYADGSREDILPGYWRPMRKSEEAREGGE